jgi:hypothetical protein
MGLVTRDMACHVLWQFSEGTVAERHRPGDFVEQLLATIVQADPFNLQLLSRSFPGYVWAVRQMRADETGIFLGQLRAVARGEEKLPAEVETVAQREQRFEQLAHEQLVAPIGEGLPAPVASDNPYRAALSVLVQAVDRAAGGVYTVGEVHAIRRGVGRALRERGMHT